ncbi:MAG: hypothetical protein VW405_08600 [Rhodospirillaceae bacterium]
MGTSLGAIAVIIALLALWFAVEAVRSIDGRGEAMLRPHLRGLKSRMAETNQRISDLEARILKVETRLVTTRMESRAARDLAEETRSIRHGLRRSRRAIEGVHAYHA